MFARTACQAGSQPGLRGSSFGSVHDGFAREEDESELASMKQDHEAEKHKPSVTDCGELLEPNRLLLSFPLLNPSSGLML